MNTNIKKKQVDTCDNSNIPMQPSPSNNNIKNNHLQRDGKRKDPPMLNIETTKGATKHRVHMRPQKEIDWAKLERLGTKRTRASPRH